MEWTTLRFLLVMQAWCNFHVQKLYRSFPWAFYFYWRFSLLYLAVLTFRNKITRTQNSSTSWQDYLRLFSVDAQKDTADCQLLTIARELAVFSWKQTPVWVYNCLKTIHTWPTTLNHSLLIIICLWQYNNK